MCGKIVTRIVTVRLWGGILQPVVPSVVMWSAHANTAPVTFLERTYFHSEKVRCIQCRDGIPSLNETSESCP